MDYSFSLTGTSAVVVFLIIAILLLIIFVYLPVKLFVTLSAHTKKRTDRIQKLSAKTVIAWYDPPEGLTPAEMGFLFDTKLGTGEVFASIVDLQQRGLVTITESEGKLEITDTVLPSADTKPFDTFLLRKLAGRKGKHVTHRWLKRIRIEADLVVKNQLGKRGYLKPLKQQIIQSFVRLLLIVVIMILIFPVLAFQPTTWGGVFGTLIFVLFTFPLYFIVAAFLYGTYQKIAGEPWLVSDKVKDIWSEIEGYREFIKQVEADNLRFDSDTTKGIIKDKALPYAIALDFDTGWRKKV